MRDHATWVRVLLGGYLMVHFAHLLPWAGELFSGGGMLPAEASPFYGHIPNPLFASASALGPPAMRCVGLLAAAALALGRRDRIAAGIAWLVWMWLYTRNPLIANPSIPFVGWMLLAHAALGRPARGLAFILIAAAYSYSGVTKLIAPSWLDGSALTALLDNPLARPSAARDLLLSMPPVVTAALSYGVLALEILFAPLSLSRRLRPHLWLAMVGMHLGILVLIDFADLTIGMLLVHAYTFDPRWWRRNAHAAPLRTVATELRCSHADLADAAVLPGNGGLRHNQERDASRDRGHPHARDGAAAGRRTGARAEGEAPGPHARAQGHRAGVLPRGDVAGLASQREGDLATRPHRGWPHVWWRLSRSGRIPRRPTLRPAGALQTSRPGQRAGHGPAAARAVASRGRGG